MVNINLMADEIHAANVKKGFYDGPDRNMGEILALIHAEVSEALEAHRADKHATLSPNSVLEIEDNEEFKARFLQTTKDTFEDEVADTIIRLLDLCGYKKIDIFGHMRAKLRYNSLRPIRHGKKY